MTPEEFRAGLELLGWKQTDFALATGLSKVAVSNWLNNTATPLPLWAQNHLRLLLKLKELSGELLTPPTKVSKMLKQ